MADGSFDVALLIPHFQAITQELQRLEEATKDGKNEPDGVTQQEQDPISELKNLIEEATPEMIQLCQDILQTNQDLLRSQEDMAKTLEDATTKQSGNGGLGLFGAGAAQGGGKTGVIKTKTARIKINDLANLDQNYGLGAALLYWKLDDIHQTMIKGGGGEEKKKSGGGIGNIFKGLLEGAAGIALLAIALILFAGALILFKIVDWDPALKGMFAFTLFVIGAIILAKLVGKEKKSFIEFAQGTILMIVGFALFALVLFLAAKMEPYIEQAMPVLGLFLLFILGSVIIANLLGINKKAFLDFALGSLLLTAAIVVFSLSLMAADWAKQFFPGCLLVLAMFMVFLIGMVFIANSVTAAVPAFVGMGLGSMLLSVGLIAFSLSLVVAAYAGPFAIDALPALGLFSLFLILMVILANSVTAATGSFVGLATGSMLLSLALVVFSVALIVVGFIGALLLGKGKEGTGEPLIYSVLMMLSLFIGFTLLGAFAAASAPALGAFAGASILLSIALVVFSLALNFMIKNFPTKELKTIRGIIGQIGIILGLTALLIIPAVLGTVGAVALMAFSVPFGISILLLTTSLRDLAKLRDEGGGLKNNKFIESMDILVAILKAVPGIGGPLLLKLLSFTAGMVLIKTAFSGVSKLVKGLKELEDLKVDDQMKATINTIFGNLTEMIKVLADNSTEMSSESAYAARQLSQALVPISESVLNIATAIKLLADPSIVEQIPGALANVKRIFDELFFEPTTGILVQLEKTPSLSKGARKTIEVLPSLTEAMSGIADLVTQTADLPSIEGVQTLLGLIGQMNTTFNELESGGFKNGLKRLKEVPDAINKFKKTATADFEKVLDSLMKLKDVNRHLDPLLRLANSSYAFTNIASGIERTTAALMTLGQNTDALFALNMLNGGGPMNVNAMKKEMASESGQADPTGAILKEISKKLDKFDKILEWFKSVDDKGIKSQGTPTGELMVNV